MNPIPLPEELVPLEVSPETEMTVYRVVDTDDLRSPQLVDCFRSHAELGIPPRRNSPHISHPAIYHGVSMRDSFDRAAALAAAFPALGDFVARIRLDRVPGATYWFWGKEPGHLTVWAPAVKLARATVDILPIVRGDQHDVLDHGQLREYTRVIRRRDDGPSHAPFDRKS
jgi:hypothetical protein